LGKCLLIGNVNQQIWCDTSNFLHILLNIPYKKNEDEFKKRKSHQKWTVKIKCAANKDKLGLEKGLWLDRLNFRNIKVETSLGTNTHYIWG